ncbi:hypothetical protein BGZ73_000020 [Actinomortierella ambigua]|nr:hypothetical protein BGZ73_000020 [Actinomortierella ambigua]
MHVLLLSGYLALASRIYADGKVPSATTPRVVLTYNVIAFPDVETNTFAVEVDNKRYALQTSADIFPLWSTTVAGATASSNYRYVQLDKKNDMVTREKFVRHLHNAHATATPNEFFNRQMTRSHLPAIEPIFKENITPALPGQEQQPIQNPQPKSKVFDPTQIATIHLLVDPAEFADMLANPLDEQRKPIEASFRFVNADTLYTADSVRLKMSGHGSRKFQKGNLHISLVPFNDASSEAGTGDGVVAGDGGSSIDGSSGVDGSGGIDGSSGVDGSSSSVSSSSSSGDNTLFGQSEIKLRAEYLDPSMIRERLYMDLLQAADVTTYQGSYARLYVNGEPHGFYLMVEDLEAPFLMNTIHNGEIQDKAQLGSLFRMGSGSPAPLVYKGRRTSSYKEVVYTNKVLGDNPAKDPMKQLIAFMKDLEEWDPASADGIAYWNERLDLEKYLRSMALEYLTGAWDSSWWRANNYMMYFHPTEHRWWFLPTDFDSSFGSADKADVATTYRHFAQTRLQRKNKDHPLVTKLIYKNKDINQRFETILATITHKMFNNRALDPRIDAYEKQIQEDVAWDRAIDRSNLPGINLGWTIKDMHQSIRGPVGNVPSGIKPWIAARAKSVPEQVHVTAVTKRR